MSDRKGKDLNRKGREVKEEVEVVEVVICDPQETGKGLIFPRL